MFSTPKAELLNPFLTLSLIVSLTKMNKVVGNQ